MEISFKNNEFRIKGKYGLVSSMADGVLISSPDGNTSKELLGAGEFEVSGISVIGLQTEEGTVFVYEVDGLRICNLTKLSKKLDDSKISIIGDIDVLLLPVCENSVEIVQQFECYYVIPFGQKTEEELEKFLKESGLTVQRMPKFNLKKEEIIEESPTQIVVLETNQ